MTQKLDFYKNFIYRLRKIELKDVVFTVSENISPKLYEYLLALDKCQFVDGSQHIYYGEIKKVIDNFVNYWMVMTHDVIKQVDRYMNIITKDELLEIMESTLNMHKIKQVDFGKQFLPVTTPYHQELYDEIEEKYKAVFESLFLLQAKIEKFDKQHYIEKFVKEKLELSIKKINECFHFTHCYISIGLSEHVNKIRVSLEETLIRIRTNLKQLQAKRNEEVTELHNQLYNTNKERLYICRQERKSSVEYAEVEKRILRLREKIGNPIPNMPIVNLTKEAEYWESRFAELIKIENAVIKIKKAQENVSNLEQEYNKMRTTELAGSKRKCFMNIGENIKRRKEYLDEKMLEAAKALLTYFGVRGFNRIFYEDNIGKYTIDEYGHQDYFFDYGKMLCHVTCDGTFKEVKYTDKYYYDDGGRYIVDDLGEKVYKVAPCTSSYKLDEDTRLIKTTKDCGHSEQVNPKCRMELKDPTDVEILPNLDIIDIKGILSLEVVKYLWTCFGYVVPEALRDVGVLVPKNPIHILAHRILAHKYNSTLTNIKKKAKEAEEYRSEIFKKRKDKAIAKSKAWKAKQVKRRKPEELDDSQDWATYNYYRSQNQLMSFLDPQDD